MQHIYANFPPRNEKLSASRLAFPLEASHTAVCRGQDTTEPKKGSPEKVSPKTGKKRMGVTGSK